MDFGSYSFDREHGDPGPGMATAFFLCFLADLTITFLIGWLDPGPFIGAGGSKLAIFFALIAPFVFNGVAIKWAANTRRERCLKGLILCTAFVVLLNGTCYGLLR